MVILHALATGINMCYFNIACGIMYYSCQRAGWNMSSMSFNGND